MGIARRTAAAAITALMLFSVAPALAQSEDEPATPATFTMQVAVGISGYAHPDEPLPVVVDLTSEELIVGRIDVESGGSTVSTDVEVPAGSVKQFVLQGAAPASRRQVRVTLVRVTGDDEEILDRQSLRIELPSSEILVGLLGIEGIETNLRSADSTPMATDIVPLPVTPPSVERGGGPLGYLVLGAGADGDDRELRVARRVEGRHDLGHLCGTPEHARAEPREDQDADDQSEEEEPAVHGC